MYKRQEIDNSFITGEIAITVNIRKRQDRTDVVINNPNPISF